MSKLIRIINLSSGATVEVLKLIVKLHMRVHCRVSAKRRIRKSLLHVPIRKFEESKELQLLRLCILTLDDVKELNLFFFLHIKFEKSKLLTSHLRAILLLFDKVRNNMYSTGIKSCPPRFAFTYTTTNSYFNKI